MDPYFVDDPAYDGASVVYISNKKLSYNTSLRVYLNDDFFEIFPTNEYFFFVPIYFLENNLLIEVVTDEQDWFAQPIGMLRKSLISQNTKLAISSPSFSFFERSMGLEYLRFNKKFTTQFHFVALSKSFKGIDDHLYQGYGLYKIQKDNKNYYFNSFKFMRKTLEYKNLDYFVCYKSFNRITYRIGKNLHVNLSSLTNKLEKFHYLTLDEKTIPMKNIVFFNKIQGLKHFIQLLQSMCSIGINLDLDRNK